MCRTTTDLPIVRRQNMLTTEKVFGSLIKLGFKEPIEQTNKKVERLNHDWLAYPVYVKPLQEQSLNTKYVLAIHPQYLLPEFESPDLRSREEQLKEWQEKLRSDGIFLNGNIEAKTSFVGFPANEKGSGQATTLNFEDYPAIEVFCKSVLRIGVAANSETIPDKSEHFPESDDTLVTEEESHLPPTELNALVKIRLGQSKFRRDLWKHWQGCSVSGCKFDKLLIASHIIPWSESIKSRLDPFNGLLLTPNLDAAFDKGYISFNDDGSILLSSELAEDDLKALNLSPSLALRDVNHEHLPYLAWHRANLFKA